MEDLEDEQVDGRDGVQQARAPRVAGLVTQGENRRSIEHLGQIGLDMFQHCCDCANHLGPPVCELL
jgi:hypothetical protein